MDRFADADDEAPTWAGDAVPVAVPVAAAGTAPVAAEPPRMPTGAEELFELGYAHFDSMQLERRQRAHLFFDRAAALAHAKAMRFLGQCFYDGIGVGRSLADAVRHWRAAGQLGDDDSQYKVAELLYYGEPDGVERNHDEAFEMFKALSEKGHAWAMYHLANMYKQGEGCEVDEGKALEWMQLATDAGHEFAEEELALMLEGLPNFAAGEGNEAPSFALPPEANDIDWET